MTLRQGNTYIATFAGCYGNQLGCYGNQLGCYGNPMILLILSQS